MGELYGPQFLGGRIRIVEPGDNNNMLRYGETNLSRTRGLHRVIGGLQPKSPQSRSSTCIKSMDWLFSRRFRQFGWRLR